MLSLTLGRRALPAIALAFTAVTVPGCSHTQKPAAATVPASAPVYPGSRVESEDMSSMIAPGAASGRAFSTRDTFATVYGWYKKNMPEGSEASHITTPQEAAVFFVGSGEDRLSVTITAAPLCCSTLIVIARTKA